MDGLRIQQGTGFTQVHNGEECVITFPDNDPDTNIVVIFVVLSRPGTSASPLPPLNMLRPCQGAGYGDGVSEGGNPIVVVVVVVFFLSHLLSPKLILYVDSGRRSDTLKWTADPEYSPFLYYPPSVGIRLERTNPTEEYFVIRLKKF